MRTSSFGDLKIRNHWLSDIQRHKENSRIETGFLFKLVSFLSFDIATHILWKFSIMQWTILSELIQRETFVTRLQNVRAWSQCTFQNLLYDKMKRRLEEQNEGHQCQSFPQQNSFAFILKRNKINPSRKGFSPQILGVFGNILINHFIILINFRSFCLEIWKKNIKNQDSKNNHTQLGFMLFCKICSI